MKKYPIRVTIIFATIITKVLLEQDWSSSWKHFFIINLLKGK